MRSSIASLASYAVLLGMVVALSAAEFKSTQLALVFGALGVGIGFGLQNVVNNNAACTSWCGRGPPTSTIPRRDQR